MKGKKIPSGDVLMVERTDSVLFGGEEGGEAKKITPFNGGRPYSRPRS